MAVRIGAVRTKDRNTVEQGGASLAHAAVTHGDQLTTAHVGPWSLQGVNQGAETVQAVALPSRGYWLMDTPAEWAPTSTYVYNDNPTNRGGVVPAGGMTIDGYTVPAGTVVAQFRDFSAGDFSAQGQGGSYVFRGCRFRSNNIDMSSQFNDYTSTYTNRLLYCDMGSPTANAADWKGSFWKNISQGGPAIMYRCYCSNQYVTFQPNVDNSEFVENYVEHLIYFGGEAGPPGDPGNPLHMACVGCEGGRSGLRIMRNHIIPQCPDLEGNVFANGSTLAFESAGGVGEYHDCQVVDNYLSGFNTAILSFGEAAGQTGIVVTGNKITTRYFTNGGISGPEQGGTHPVPWGSSGNVKSGNVWADDYGTGGNGTGTPLTSRQYPSGNGPRAGTTAF